ncbi:ABC transporter ATP-binding protein [Neopusillimonas maritima]|jgi:ABC-type oligopeptide transport system ATPase subunit|uniref:Dipeptide/oligopeptide/nickel ABC transporter ATP-binding protein n=1 Tax=Neopusillimonas maritima TaxID=2026239 RepID=A0ABX9MZ12_9BURK|nr:dipeptide/oligopeptide/nickel ABC transporter ATP-binding protein [Neopusillimonas maritima]RII84192.1 dipeptide/oligopeptide/nickel ABC transporter ATP-binding protein [Neopusillimonas maritima]|tara:strand:- start:1321 stop:2148 length:828 start_codon:yes stop_codon:yes gene_type:complete
MAEPLFSVRDLHLALPDMTRKPLFGPAPRIEILKGLSFDLPAGEITGIVGESGSGKSTLGRVLVRLLGVSSGQVLFRGKDISHLDEVQLKPLRRDLQMIFQDPMSSLNPRHTVGRIVASPIKRYGIDAPEKKAYEALERVGLSTAFAKRYPHELSGGQRQRVGIARAVALNPAFILADEIVSGLDVSSQAQVLTLLRGLAADMNLTIAFISHDLSVIRTVCSQVMVLNRGEIVEAGRCDQVFDAPQSEVTHALIDAIPLPEMDDEWFDSIKLDKV